MIITNKEKIKEILREKRKDYEVYLPLLDKKGIYTYIIDNCFVILESLDFVNKNTFIHFVILNKKTVRSNFKKIVEFLENLGIKKMYLSLFAKDKRMQKFAEIFGFKKEARLKEYFFNGEDCLIYGYKIGDKENV
jgi:hypothetical protein